ncbi:uncharacterized protein RHO25_006995 [Cercospora beticola]|uniref:Uncharacterized protein n=1 Tax=Cercospora beticola TaxID=122368 RepID=A0ABZ0NSA7_CERBT|nr:hypothetical protein RHO25_006995 [Cercospora beticola]
MKISIIAGIIAYSSAAFASALPDPELEERQLGTTYTCVMNPRGNGYCQINNPPPVDPPPPATLGCHKVSRIIIDEAACFRRLYTYQQRRDTDAQRPESMVHPQSLD